MAKQSATLSDMREVIAAKLAADPEALNHPKTAAAAAVEAIRETWGGCSGVYIPKIDTLDERDWQMWQAFNGANYDEVGKLFGLTGRQTRNRRKIIRPIAQAREQKSLFDVAANE